MEHFTFWISLLPVIFMFHDFEEIIFFRGWLKNNEEQLKKRFPKLCHRILPRLASLSTPAFTFAVAEEFILLSLITYLSVYFSNYYLWMAAFMGFSIHIIIHIIQWLIIRRYIPNIISSILVLPYCIYTFHLVFTNKIFMPYEIILLSLGGILFVGGNVIFAHYLAHSFDKRNQKNKTNENDTILFP